MRVCIHQLNFMPWPGYFNKMIKSDVFILDVDSKVGEFTRRAKLSRQHQGSNKDYYLTLPLNGRTVSIGQCQFTPHVTDWPERVFGDLKAAYAKAPYWKVYEHELAELLGSKSLFLWQYNLAALIWLRVRLKINTPLALCADHSGDSTTDRLIHASKSVGASSCILGSSFKAYGDMDAWRASGLGLVIQNLAKDPSPYSTLHWLLTIGPERTRELVVGFATFERLM